MEDFFRLLQVEAPKYAELVSALRGMGRLDDWFDLMIESKLGCTLSLTRLFVPTRLLTSFGVPISIGRALVEFIINPSIIFPSLPSWIVTTRTELQTRMSWRTQPTETILGSGPTLCRAGCLM